MSYFQEAGEDLYTRGILRRSKRKASGLGSLAPRTTVATMLKCRLGRSQGDWYPRGPIDLCNPTNYLKRKRLGLSGVRSSKQGSSPLLFLLLTEFFYARSKKTSLLPPSCSPSLPSFPIFTHTRTAGIPRRVSPATFCHALNTHPYSSPIPL